MNHATGRLKYDRYPYVPNILIKLYVFRIVFGSLIFIFSGMLSPVPPVRIIEP